MSIEGIAERIKADLLADKPKVEKAACLQCGCGVDPQKAALGGRGRFCNDRCLSYFDAGRDAQRGPAWMCSPPVDGQTAFDPLRNARKRGRDRTAHSKLSCR
jgi:hypothetical protein